MVVTLGEWVKSFFGASSPEPPDALELEANSESELSSSLSRLRVGQKGWRHPYFHQWKINMRLANWTTKEKGICQNLQH